MCYYQLFYHCHHMTPFFSRSFSYHHLLFYYHLYHFITFTIENYLHIKIFFKSNIEKYLTCKVFYNNNIYLLLLFYAYCFHVKIRDNNRFVRYDLMGGPWRFMHRPRPSKQRCEGPLKLQRQLFYQGFKHNL
ncbi:hypothetical protein POPTR_008G029550v4 [Populus trichocarpa]|jgi:hypothetical protein|uniref:Uncharacterized protein n=1 Tax=Populus trichocarpa TaxID=3694 RepID=A0ACC0SJA1_POPTR|nr:hypothetical protein POPTR_008G029550v4 [Populus trichocarpa]